MLLNFLKVWMETPHIDRGLLVKEWVSGNRINAVQRTDVGTNAGGGNKTDRNPDYAHTLDTLDQEIALATLPMDFDIYDFPVSVHRRAKDIIAAKESPWKEWSAALRKTPGILDYSRAAIFAMIRDAGDNVHHFPDSLRRYINSRLNESVHDKPAAEMVDAANKGAVVEDLVGDEISKLLASERGEFVEGISDPADPKWVTEDLTKKEQPQIASLGAGMFSIEGLMASPAPTNAKEEATSNVQMEAAQPVKVKIENTISAGESADAAAAQTGAITTAAGDVNQNQASVAQNEPNVNHSEPESGEIEPECKPVWPEFFEPGRYEGLPNEVYHAANGISSTQIKDARISLMYFHARHVAKLSLAKALML